METKVCCNCNNEYPKTEKYYFKRVIKHKLVTGKIKLYFLYRSDCKKCYSKKNGERRLRKRFKELNCNAENYKKVWTNEIRQKRYKYDCFKELNLPQSKIQYIRKKIDEGYEFTTIEKYEEDSQKNIRKGQLNSRKYSYDSNLYLSSKEKQKMQILNLAPSRIALGLGISVKDLSPEILETKQLIIKLKRELKNNNVKIK